MYYSSWRKDVSAKLEIGAGKIDCTNVSLHVKINATKSLIEKKKRGAKKSCQARSMIGTDKKVKKMSRLQAASLIFKNFKLFYL